MNILFFSTYYHPYLSGITTYPKKLLQYLSHRHHIQVLTFRHDFSLPIKEKEGNLAVHRLSYLFRLSKGFISPQSIFTFIQYLRQTDLIFLNLPNVEGLPLALFARIVGRPVISIFHCRIDLGPGPVNRFISFLTNTSIYLQLLLSSRIVAYTPDYFTSLSWFKHLISKVVYILPPVSKLPVDRDYLTELKSRKQNSIWIGFAGRISKEKGLTYLIDAMAALQHKYNLKLVFAGPKGKEVVGEDDYYQLIIGRLKNKLIQYRFLGTLEQGKLGAFYQAIDLLVLPSINQTEAFGMVQVEAMLLGTPVIASDLPGVRTPIRMTSMGLIVQPKNTNDLITAIKRIIIHRSIYINSINISNIVRIFNIQETFNKFDTVINDIQLKSNNFSG